MEFLVRHIQRTSDIAGGFVVGTLVIDDGVYIQAEDGELTPVTSAVEVKNGGHWQHLSATDILRRTTEGWPAYAGMDARMKGAII